MAEIYANLCRAEDALLKMHLTRESWCDRLVEIPEKFGVLVKEGFIKNIE